MHHAKYKGTKSNQKRIIRARSSLLWAPKPDWPIAIPSSETQTERTGSCRFTVVKILCFTIMKIRSGPIRVILGEKRASRLSLSLYTEGEFVYIYTSFIMYRGDRWDLSVISIKWWTNVCECSWTYVNVRECTRMFVNICKHPWIFVDVFERSWKFVNVCECPRTFVNDRECLWKFMNSAASENHRSFS